MNHELRIMKKLKIKPNKVSAQGGLAKSQNQASPANQASSGFTLIEILIVVVIAVIVFIAMYSFYASTIKFDTESRYEIIASNLAQEGVELCRNGRDNEILQEGNLDNFDKNKCKAGPDGIDGDQLDGTIFNRQCGVSDISGGSNEKFLVECTVTWDSFASKGTLQRSVEATSVLTNWAE